MFYRVLYKNIGIYEALKNNVSFKIWKSLLNSNIFNWLPKPPQYLNGYSSYFTELGFKKFKENVLPVCEKYLNKNEIKILKIKLLQNVIIYQDDFQVIVYKRNKIYESKFDQLYLKIINKFTRNKYEKF